MIYFWISRVFRYNPKLYRLQRWISLDFSKYPENIRESENVDISLLILICEFQDIFWNRQTFSLHLLNNSKLLPKISNYIVGNHIKNRNFDSFSYTLRRIELIEVWSDIIPRHSPGTTNCSPGFENYFSTLEYKILFQLISPNEIIICEHLLKQLGKAKLKDALVFSVEIMVDIFMK